MGSGSFLKRAEDYAELRGDSDMFKEIYQQKREVFSVKESTWGALFALYGAKIADHLEVL